MSHPRRPRARRGFTLIELLVVIAVLAVVSTIGMRAFFSVTDGWRQLSLRTALSERATAAFETLQRDLGQVTSARLGGVAIVGSTRLEEAKRYGRVPLEDDLVTLPVQLPTAPGAPPTQRLQVTYQIDRSSNPPALVRREAPLGSAPGDGATQVVAAGVLALRVEYYDGATWARTWNATQHPTALRVGLVLQDADRPYEQTARTAVFAVAVE